MLLEKAEREGYPNLLPCEKNGGGLLNLALQGNMWLKEKVTSSTWMWPTWRIKPTSAIYLENFPLFLYSLLSTQCFLVPVFRKYYFSLRTPTCLCVLFSFWFFVVVVRFCYLEHTVAESKLYKKVHSQRPSFCSGPSPFSSLLSVTHGGIC